LVVLPDYQQKGIGTELIKRCIEHFPESEWMLWTSENNIKFYEKVGFKQYEGVVMSIPPFWSRNEDV
jgi:predicted N-acetyltransferase YhbS